MSRFAGNVSDVAAVAGKAALMYVTALVADGEIRRRELRRCGLTDNDLYTHLRAQGFFTTSSLLYVLYETKGSLTVVPADGGGELVERALKDAVGRPPR